MNANNTYLNLKGKQKTLLWSLIIGLVSLVLIGSASFVLAHDDSSHSVGTIGSIERVDDTLQAKITAPDNHRVHTVAVAPVDNRNDCDDDASFGDDITSGFGVKLTTNMFVIDADVTNDDIDFDDMYACFQVVYKDRTDSDGSTAHDELYIVSNSKVDLAAPEIEKVTLDRTSYDTTMIGKKAKLMVEFDEAVEVVRTATKPSNPNDLPMLTVGGLTFTLMANDKTAVNDVIASGTTLTFEKELMYTDGYMEIDEPAITNNFGTTSNAAIVKIVDEFGNMVSLDDVDSDITGDDIEDVVINMTPMVQIERDDDKLVVMATPSKYDSNNNGTDNADTVGSWMYRMSKVNPGNDTCREIDADGDEDDNDYVSGQMSATDGMITLPEDANNAWYCFTGTLAGASTNWDDREDDNMIDTTWYQYRVDSDNPRFVSVNHGDNGESLVIKTSDTSGIREVAWVVLNNQNDPCVAQLTFTNVLDTDTSNGVTMATINVDSALDGIWICIRAEDNVGKRTVQRAQLKMTSTEDSDDMDDTTTTPPVTVDPVDDMEDDMSDEDMDDEADTSDDSNTVRLPANWDELSAEEKTAANPYKCLDTTQIRADNGQCLSGGSALGDDVTVVSDDDAVVETPVVDPTTPVDDTEDPTTPVDDTEDPTTPVDDTEDPTTPVDDTEDPVDPVDDTEDPENDEDEDDGFPVVIIAVIVVIIIVIGIIVVASNRKNNQI